MRLSGTPLFVVFFAAFAIPFSGALPTAHGSDLPDSPRAPTSPVGTGSSKAFTFDGYTIVDHVHIPRLPAALDRENYARLAGIYTFSEPRYYAADILHFHHATFSWGVDYSLGKYAEYIDFDGKQWYAASNGLALTFQIVASTSSAITVDYGANVEPRFAVFTFKADKLLGLQTDPVYKISGPDRPMQLLRRILLRKKAELHRYGDKIVPPEQAKRDIGNLYLKVFAQLRANDRRSIMKEISQRYGIRFGFGQKPLFPSRALKPQQNDDQKIAERLDFESQMINELDNSEVVDGKIYFNEYRYLDLEEINSRYPHSITVEMHKDWDTMYSLVFVHEKGTWRLAAIVDDFDQE